MKVPLLLIFTLIILQLNFPSISASLEEICKKVTSPRDKSEYNFCLKSLQSDPKSRTANTSGCALIATKLAKAQFKCALTTLNRLLRGNVTNVDRRSLLDCSEVYGYGIYTLQKAIGAIRSGGRNNAINYLSASLTDISTCEEGFDELDANKTLVAEVDYRASKISSLALAIANLM